ncbi:MAG: glycogen synthase GlgA [Vicinamibacteraceae bacterium]|nr:glycogen synthase GlgA [Vicinamibacteraceae bacterium]
MHVEPSAAAPAAEAPDAATVAAPAPPVDTTDAATAVAPGDNEVVPVGTPEPSPSLSILMVAPEALPFAKTGGLADVAGALPLAFGRLGHRVTLVLPRYRGMPVEGPPVARLAVPMGGTALDTSFYEVRLGDRARAVLVDRPDLFDREFLYGVGNDDYADNPFRFGFLSRAALEFAAHTGMRPDVVHAHDWQAGLVPAYLETAFAGHPAFAQAARVFTVHNLAYQGLCSSEWLPRLGLPWSIFNIDGLEYWLHASLLKSGIVFSHMVTTVSPSYARQTLTPEFGFGFEGILAARADEYVGILNGIDAGQWDPARDPYLPLPYDASRLADKRASKHALLTRYGLPTDEGTMSRPLVGMISRMVDQKGLDIIAANAAVLPDLGATFAILGTGESRYQDMWRALAAHAPDRIGVFVGFDEARAHLIEAGADIFMMPSRFEPCGLNQMYSMRYGTVPVVHATGGLADTVEPWNPATRRGTGFTFTDYRPGAFLAALRDAIDAYGHRETWRSLQQQGMAQDFSWERSARAYIDLYATARARAGVTGN